MTINVIGSLIALIMVGGLVTVTVAVRDRRQAKWREVAAERRRRNELTIEQYYRDHFLVDPRAPQTAGG